MNEETRFVQAESNKTSEFYANFISDMIHDLKTPLNGILGYSHILKDIPELSKEVKSSLSEIEGCGIQLLELINNINEVAQLESNQIIVLSQLFNPRSTIEIILSSYRLIARQKNLSISADISSSIPENIMGDDKKIQKILSNLFSTFIKVTDSGCICLSVWFHEQSLFFQLKNNSIGISSDALYSIFSKAKNDSLLLSGAKRYDSSELGLNIAKRLVDILEGTWNFEYKEKEGVTLSFSVKAHENEIPGDIFRPLDAAGSSIIHNKKILIIDDNIVNRQVLNKILASAGFSICEADNGETGIAAAMKEKPDMILVDLFMPKVNGYEFIKYIREDSVLRAIPCFAVSAGTEGRSSVEEIKKLGFDNIFFKPIHKKDIIEKINTYFQQNHFKENNEYSPVINYDDVTFNHEMISSFYDCACSGDIARLQNDLRLFIEKAATENDRAFTSTLNKLIYNFKIEEVIIFIEKVLKKADG